MLIKALIPPDIQLISNLNMVWETIINQKLIFCKVLPIKSWSMATIHIIADEILVCRTKITCGEDQQGKPKGPHLGGLG